VTADGRTNGTGRAVVAPPWDAEQLDAQAVLALTLDVIGRDRLALSSSFGPEGIVILDILSQLEPQPRVIMLDTGRLPEETHRLADRIRERYDIRLEVFFPDTAAVQSMVGAKGSNLFYGSVDQRLECCYVRKVEPLQRALATVDGWIVGLRRDQAPSRARVRKIGIDLEHGMIWKVAPLADWTEEQVWDYIRTHDLPYNELHDRGYSSIGCAPCTRPTEAGEDPRAGRWWWETGATRECGMHVPAAPSEGTRTPVGAAT
jgi:thioredoxin-dependent adenylylsulfate APS reductase